MQLDAPHWMLQVPASQATPFVHALAPHVTEHELPPHTIPWLMHPDAPHSMAHEPAFEQSTPCVH
jgi:hypothetical protein